MILRYKISRKTKSQYTELNDKLKYNHIDLFYWKPPHGSLNFGDYLSKIIVSKILADKGYFLEEKTPSSGRLLAIGSILHFANSNDVIWGTGVNGKISESEHKYVQLDVRAVRGPLTREFLLQKGINVPEIYGDPAILLPIIFPEQFKNESKKSFVVVPNLHDLKIARGKKWKNIVSPLWSWDKCITEILKADFVIASSLHGLIIAEAYGIPARYIRLSETENLLKYNDYMMGTGRGEIEFAKTIEEALKMGGMQPPRFNTQKLLDAFPLDLWR
jgi:pyruvyltransferase